MVKRDDRMSLGAFFPRQIQGGRQAGWRINVGCIRETSRPIGYPGASEERIRAKRWNGFASITECYAAHRVCPHRSLLAGRPISASSPWVTASKITEAVCYPGCYPEFDLQSRPRIRY